MFEGCFMFDFTTLPLEIAIKHQHFIFLDTALINYISSPSCYTQSMILKMYYVVNNIYSNINIVLYALSSDSDLKKKISTMG